MSHPLHWMKTFNSLLLGLDPPIIYTGQSSGDCENGDQQPFAAGHDACAEVERRQLGGGFGRQVEVEQVFEDIQAGGQR